ncbi:MAG: hypothetical protein ACO1RT_10815 [Planctomycetaceae bacterium]
MTEICAHRERVRSWPYFLLAASIIAIALTWAAPRLCAAPPPPAGGDNESLGVGIDGIYRPGIWTAIERPAALDKTAVVQTLDGDGVKVLYEQTVSSESRWLYAVPGSPFAPLVITDDQNRELYRGRFSGRPIEPKMPWVVVFGDPLGVEQIGRNDLLNRESTVAVSVIRRGDSFPDQVVGLSGVDLIILGPSGIDVLADLTPQQGSAFSDWIRRGGRVLLSLGSDAEALLGAAPWLSGLLPIDRQQIKTVRLDPSAIETFTSSQTRLPMLDAAELPLRGGETRIAGRNASRQPARTAVEYAIGFGRVTLVAVALDSPELAAWPQRSLLVSRLAGTLFATELDGRRETRTSTAVSYDDIAGQVRAALDRFDSRRRIPYSLISLILIALAAMIGPIDYLVVNRLLGRPLLGWITFPLSVLLVSGLFLLMGRPAADGAQQDAGSTAAHHNQIQIVDVDTRSQPPTGRGWSWSHLSAVDATITPYPAQLQASLMDPDAAHPTVSAPFGYPGPTFGGISIAGEDTRLPAYRISISDNDEQGFRTEVSAIPLPPGGSKGIASRWTFEPKLSGRSDLSRRRGSELLTGRLTNPLPVDILNGALVFGEWVYVLPTRFRAGQTIENIESLRQKNFRWLLARREALENSTRSEPWNAEMYDDLPRLAEVLMFDSVYGGRDYTGLANRPLVDLDLAYVLNQNTALLYGQLERPPLRIDLPVQRGSACAVRVVLNVDPPRLGGS